MSIFLSTDIISDVARAADPVKRGIATKRLADISSAHGGTARGVTFGAIVDDSHRVKTATASSRSRALATGVAERPRPAKSQAAVAAEKFEAYILQSWLEVLLPKVEGGSFGSGGAGNIWRSMMAEQLGAQLAKSGAVGIQKILDRNDYSASELRPLPPPTPRRA